MMRANLCTTRAFGNILAGVFAMALGLALFAAPGLAWGVDGVDAGTGSDASVSAGVDEGAGNGVGIDPGTDVGNGAGTDLGTGTGVGTGADSGTGASVGTGAGVDVGVGADSGADAGASSGVGLERVGAYVFDERGLFTADEFSNLESRAAGLADAYGMGVYLLTTGYMDGRADPTAEQRTGYATRYYRDHGLGLNKGSGSIGDGIMLVIAADSRDYVTIAYGQGSYSFSDAGIESMEDAVISHLSGNDWYGAAETYYAQVAEQLNYYERHGSAQEPLDAFDWALRLFIIIGIPLIITFFVIRRERDAMKTAREQSEAGHYLDPSSLNVLEASDQFVNTTLVATPRPKDTDSGGGGGWGGGGGGGFSSSGGGKF